MKRSIWLMQIAQAAAMIVAIAGLLVTVWTVAAHQAQPERRVFAASVEVSEW